LRIALKLFASLTDYLPLDARKVHRLDLELPEGTTIAEVIGRQNLPQPMCHLVLVNGFFVPPKLRATRELGDGDELAIWPPVAGG
jgi:sulfur carrier protein ThiS